MAKNIISLLLLLLSLFLSISHARAAFRPPEPENVKMMENLGITRATLPYLGIFSILTGLMLLFPQTFVLSNILNAITIVLIMALSLRAGDVKTAVIEIPFLALPLILLYLNYPFKN